uniref:ABC transporter ATP-binding protein n=1 Tax=uncultured Nitratireductor sp. TaxID=520953 RepID=UPI0025D90D31
NLDAKLRGKMRAELKHMQHQLGITTIYVTHDQIEAMTLAHRVAIMRDGVLQQLGTPKEVYADPANLFVAGFIGSPGMNFLSAHYVPGENGASARLGDGTLIGLSRDCGLAADAPITVGIRPEHVVLSDADGAGVDAGVELIEPTGFGTILHLTHHGLPFKVFTIDRSLLNAGPAVKVSFPSAHVHVFDSEGDRVTA